MSLAWRRVLATTPEFQASSATGDREYTIAKYLGQSRRDGQWRLTASDEDETLNWCSTLADAKAIAEAYEVQAQRAPRATKGSTR